MDSSSFQFLSSKVEAIRTSKNLSLLFNKDIIDSIDAIGACGEVVSFGHFYHLLDFDIFSTISGEDVLEIGGALSPDLVFNLMSAKSWTSIQKLYLSADLNRGNNDNSLPHTDVDLCYRTISHPNGLAGAYNESLIKDCAFGRIFSLACFEHVFNLYECLEIAWKCLKPGGVLYSYFTPIWSSEFSHLPVPHKNLDEPYYHLFYDYTSMYYRLLSLGLDGNAASAAAYEHYKGESLNRYTFEDYECIFKASPFKKKFIQPINYKKLSSLDLAVQDRIKSNYPRIKSLATGFRLIFIKDA